QPPPAHVAYAARLASCSSCRPDSLSMVDLLRYPPQHFTFTFVHDSLENASNAPVHGMFLAPLDPGHGLQPRMALSLLVALYLLLVVALPLALSATVNYRSLPEGTTCPLCRSATLLLRSRTLGWTSAVLRRVVLQRRWCLTCGWEGVCKLTGEAARRARRRDGPRLLPPGDTRPHAPPPGGMVEAVDLRDLEVEGCAWRVLVECWYEAGRWYGRLLFSAPGGQLRADASRTFCGRSRRDVLD